jgi:phosphoribosyl-ATP pyrophosphohydrolase
MLVRTRGPDYQLLVLLTRHDVALPDLLDMLERRRVVADSG